MKVADFFGTDGLIAKVKDNFRDREGQQEAAQMIVDASAEGGHGFIEASTGFGKSITALTAAVDIVLNQRKRVVISTETINLQQQYVELDLPLIHEATGGGFTFAVAKGRSNYICKAKFVEARATGRMTPIQQWASAQQIGIHSGDKSSAPASCTEKDFYDVAAEDDCERRACAFYGDGHLLSDCFVYRAMAERRDADIIVTNHTMLLLDLQLGAGSILGPYDVLIVDEAHSLPEKAQQTWGSEFGPRTISKTVQQIEKLLTRAGITGVFEPGYLMGYQMMEEEIFKPFKHYLKDSVKLSAIPEAAQESQAIAEEVIGDLKELSKALKEKASIFTSEDPQHDAITSARGKLGKLYGNLVRVYGELAPGDDEKVLWLSYLETRYNSHKEKYGVLHAKPIEVAPLMRGLLYNVVPTVIMCSATLRINNSFWFMRKEMGAPAEKVFEFVGESPFNFEKNALAYFPTHLPDPNSAGYEEELTEEIKKVILRGEGKALVLFTNANLMRNVAADIRLPYRVMVQGEMPKMRLIEEFKNDLHSCLFATRSFFTGVDIPGEALSTVILTKAPFRVPTDPLFAARCALIKSKGGNDFSDYSLPLMLLDVRQAFGRLIRTETDTGTFALLDSRALQKGYGANIRRALPAMRKVTAL